MLRYSPLKLWVSGVVELPMPTSLQNAVFYTIGKMFFLRGGQEHRSLKLSQFVCSKEPDCYVYHENTSKNHNGSFKLLHVKPKVVSLYSVPEVGERCPINILDKYISKLPPQAVEKDLFYPLGKVPCDHNSPWYTTVPIESIHSIIKSN